MNILVPLKQVPDLVEELEFTPDGTRLDTTFMSMIINEADDHALEQALLLKEKHGARVTVVALDVGEAEEMLYTALAKGADEALLMAGDFEDGVDSHTIAALLAEICTDRDDDLILTGCQAVDDLDGQVGVLLSAHLDRPYVGLVTHVEPVEGGLRVHKELPGGLYGTLQVALPAVLGILAADNPPRYVLVSKVMDAMKTAPIEELDAPAGEGAAGFEIVHMDKPEAGNAAEMIEGAPEAVAERLADLFVERGILK